MAIGHMPEQSNPIQGRIVAVANQKGGVGKTTTAINVATSLALEGRSVLLVDVDPQGNLTSGVGMKGQRAAGGTAYEALMSETAEAGQFILPTRVQNLSLIPADRNLTGAEIEMVPLLARERRLQRVLEPLRSRFEFIYIDCPPSLGLLTLNALVAGDEMLIPIQAEYYALEGLGQLLETVEMVRQHLNPRLNVSTIMVTMYDGRTRLAQGVAEEVREHFGDQVLKTTVPRSVRVSEAPSYGQTVMTYDPGSTGALCYLEAAREIATKGAPT
jgi:chromosome partitioning protein